MNFGIAFKNLLEYILCTCIVINCNTVWQQTKFSKINNLIMILSIMILCFTCFPKICRKRNVLFKTVIMISIIFVYNIIFIWINHQNTKSYIVRFVVILLGLLLYSIYATYNKKRDSLLIKISNIMIVLSIVSLIMYISIEIFGIISTNSFCTYIWGTIRTVPTYHNLYYQTQFASIGSMHFIRNTGIFTEGPMYSFILCIALMVQLFYINKINRKKIIILVITILSTLSTTGIIIMLVVLSIKFLSIKGKNKYYSILKLILVPLVLSISLLSIVYFIDNKIQQSKSGTYGSSYSVRIDDFKVGFTAWDKHKLIGNGYDRHDITQLYMNKTLRGDDTGGSSGLMAVLAQGGVYLLSIYLFSLIIAIVYFIKYKKMNEIVFCIIIAILFIVTNIPYTYIMMYLIALGYSSYFIRIGKCN